MAEGSAADKDRLCPEPMPNAAAADADAKNDLLEIFILILAFILLLMYRFFAFQTPMDFVNRLATSHSTEKLKQNRYKKWVEKQ